MLVSLEFLVHVWRNPQLREAFADRIAAPRLALGRFLEAEAQASGIDYPVPAHDLATVLRELGTGLGLAKLADPDAIRDELFGDFVERFFELVIRASVPEHTERSAS
jgi:hypothetical protein